MRTLPGTVTATHFHELGFRVPEVYARDDSYQYFLLQDLGTTDLFSLLQEKGEDSVKSLYQKVMHDLVAFQVKGIEKLDLDVAYPTRLFDRRSVMWDLNYFKYYFVKTHDLIFDEDLLETDFEKLSDQLLASEISYFMYRDFQARNILIHDVSPGTSISREDGKAHCPTTWYLCCSRQRPISLNPSGTKCSTAIWKNWHATVLMLLKTSKNICPILSYSD